MLTDQDIQKLTVVFATREEVALKVDVDEMRTELRELKESVRSLATSVDNLAKAVETLRVEYAAMSQRTERHEKWILQLAKKLGLDLET